MVGLGDTVHINVRQGPQIWLRSSGLDMLIDGWVMKTVDVDHRVKDRIHWWMGGQCLNMGKARVRSWKVFSAEMMLLPHPPCLKKLTPITIEIATLCHTWFWHCWFTVACIALVLCRWCFYLSLTACLSSTGFVSLLVDSSFVPFLSFSHSTCVIQGIPPMVHLQSFILHYQTKERYDCLWLILVAT